MKGPDPNDPDWSDLVRAFDDLVERDAAERAAVIAAAGWSATFVARLQHLFTADATAGEFLAPGSAAPVLAAVASAGVAADEERSSLALPYQLGRYELRTLLGRGGMGEVYFAHDRELDRPVAIKLLAEHLLRDPQWLLRFRREARTAGGLDHPGIVTVHDVGEAAGRHFLCTEFVAGETLRQWLARGPIAVDSALDAARQIAAALAAAHAAGIVHRDLKPENVMVRGDGRVKVLDFGLAKVMGAGGVVAAANPTQTATGVLLGTIRYMSPEQARGLVVDARSDVFAFGALLHEMLTGEPPFGGATPLDVLVAVLDREAPPLRGRVTGMPDGLVEIVARALAKEPTRRYADGGELLAALEALAQPHATAAAGEPVPEVRYARSGETDIAYQVFGEGPIDLVFVMGWISHLEYFWREPSFARFLRQLARFARVIVFDKRGTGLSDRVAVDRLPTLEQRMDDVRAVLDQVGSRRAVLCGISEGGPMCALFAATHPERTIALVMIGSYARRLVADDYPWGVTAEARERFCDEIRRGWGGPVGIAERAPSAADDPAFREWWAAYLRHGATPSAAIALTRMNAAIDIRAVLPSVRVPTLVVHRADDRCLRLAEGRFLAERIPGAQFVELPGADHLPFVGDQDAVIAAIERFLTALPPARPPRQALATVCAATFSTSSDEAAEAFRRAVSRDTGVATARAMSVGEQQLLAAFDGPARAIHTALELCGVGARLGLALHLGVHTDGCDLRGLAAVGPAVEIATAIAQRARAGEVLVSAAARDLVAGAGLSFTPSQGELVLPDGRGMALFVAAADQLRDKT